MYKKLEKEKTKCLNCKKIMKWYKVYPDRKYATKEPEGYELEEDGKYILVDTITIGDWIFEPFDCWFCSKKCYNDFVNKYVTNRFKDNPPK